MIFSSEWFQESLSITRKGHCLHSSSGKMVKVLDYLFKSILNSSPSSVSDFGPITLSQSTSQGSCGSNWKDEIICMLFSASGVKVEYKANQINHNALGNRMLKYCIIGLYNVQEEKFNGMYEIWEDI